MNPENQNDIVEGRFATWVQKNTRYDPYSNEIILPGYVRDYMIDYNGSELKFLEILMKYYKTKYMENSEVLNDYRNGDLFVSFEDSEFPENK